MPAFNSRIGPKEIAGRPAALFYYGIPVLILLGLNIVLPFILIRLVCIPAAIILAVMCIYEVYHHKDMLLLRAKRLSKREARCYTITDMRY